MEKRIYPRIETKLPAIVMNQDGVRFRGVVVDASSEGLSIECSIMERNQVTPGGCFVRQGKPVELAVFLDLPEENDHDEELQILCHVVFSRRISSSRCKIGMQFMSFESGDYENLLCYIESLLSHQRFG